MKKQSVRQGIRKVNKGNSFYDVMKSRNYKDKMAYKLVAGLTMPIFSKARRK